MVSIIWIGQLYENFYKNCLNEMPSFYRNTKLYKITDFYKVLSSYKGTILYKSSEICKIFIKLTLLKIGIFIKFL